MVISMKHIRTLILPLLMLLVAVPACMATGPAVYLDDRALYFDVEPVIEDGRTLVPLRGIFEAMGTEVTWEQETQTARAVKGNTTVVLKVGSTSPTVNGQVQVLDVPAKIVDQRILAPLRFVGEAFGGTVRWDQAAYRIDIETEAGDTAINKDRAILSITGAKLTAPKHYGLADLQAMKDIIITDTYYSRGKAKENWAAASHNQFTGVSLEKLIDDKAGTKEVPSRIKIVAEDGYTLMLSWDEVKASYIDETDPDKQLTTILAWSQDGQLSNFSDGSGLRLIIGQKYQGDYNRQRWVHSVKGIEVQ